MKSYTKTANPRYLPATALAVFQIVAAVALLLAWGMITAVVFFLTRYVWTMGGPFTVTLLFSLLFLALWVGSSGIISFAPIRQAKELEEALADGPVSMERLGDNPHRLMGRISRIKRRKLFASIAVLEDCIVFERQDTARPLLLMADKGMHFVESKRRVLPWNLFAAFFCAAAYRSTLVGAPDASFWVIGFAVLLGLSLLLTKPSARIRYQSIPEKEEPILEMPQSGDTAADTLIEAASNHIRELNLLDDAIHDSYVSERIREIAVATRQLMEFLRTNPHKQSGAKQLIDYALPTTIKLLRQYDYLNRQPVKGETIHKSMAKIVEMSGTVAETMKRELDALYQDGAIDIEVDIEVMNNMLHQESNDFRMP